eukprot:CAMPEP_0182941720 /NCGR_PEP_ID=MMETSP0105_2-20130417/49388_1 /TAXON_ID=81532 ORGANISM="Acanthoeca-like sp., Strain 10tr" /NCGR_SAMPLE_ID=MMETSP0105_2 /ASSEMBLY_ACC=CAM_ASM_000205 /LENGTH=31 /DNA_ID= /DNA_START= /DNA_END= /DNA_ORIENTATION=
MYLRITSRRALRGANSDASADLGAAPLGVGS